MADFTAELQDPIYSAKRVMDPGPASFNPLGGIANLGSSLVSGLTQFTQQGMMLGDRKAENQATQTGFDYLAAKQASLNAPQPGAAPITAPIGPSVGAMPTGQAPSLTPNSQNIINGITSVQNAAQNGSVPADYAQLHLENSVSQLLAENPNSKAVVFNQLQRMGLWSQVYEDAQHQMYAEQQMYEAGVQKDIQYYNAAVQAGRVTPDMTREQAIQEGQLVTQSRYAFDLSTKMLENTKTQTEIDASQYKLKSEQRSVSATQDGIKMFNDTVGSSLNAFSSLNQGALTTEDVPALVEAQKTLPQYFTYVDAHARDIRAKLVASGADPSHLDAFDKYVKDTKDSLSAVLTGDASQLKVNAQVLANMQAGLGIDAIKASRSFSLLSKMVGPNATATLFGGNITSLLGSDMLKQIKTDLANIDTTGFSVQNTSTLMSDLNNALKGRVKLSQLDPATAKQYLMPAMLNIHKAHAMDIAGGATNDDTINQFRNTTAELSEAAMTVGPGVGSFQALKNLKDSLFGAPTTQAYMNLGNLGTHSYSDNIAMVTGSRAAAAHTLAIADTTADPSQQNGILKSVYDPTQGRFVVQADRKLFDKALSYVDAKAQGKATASTDDPFLAQINKTGIGSRDFGVYERMANDPNSQIAQLTAIKNSALDHLYHTRNYDSSLPPGVADRDVRDFYATGKVSPDMQAKLDKQTPQVTQSSHDSLMKGYSDLRSSLNTNTLELEKDPSMRLVNPQPSNLHEAFWGQESGNNDNVKTSVDGAVGPGQMTPGTFKTFAKPGEDIHNPADNRAVSARAIDYYYEKYGDVPRAAVAYFSGEGNVSKAGEPVPWKKDHADGNGKSVSGYVSDILHRLHGVNLG